MVVLYYLHMKPLEEHTAFTYVAWTLIFGFSFFVGNLALTLKDAPQTYAPNEVIYAELQRLEE